MRANIAMTKSATSISSTSSWSKSARRCKTDPVWLVLPYDFASINHLSNGPGVFLELFIFTSGWSWSGSGALINWTWRTNCWHSPFVNDFSKMWENQQFPKGRNFFLFENYISNLRELNYTLSCVATVVFSVRLLHAIAFSKKLRWFEPTKVITLKTQTLAVHWKRLWQRSFRVEWIKLRCHIFNMRSLHAFAFSKWFNWFEPTNVISLKTQSHAVNARWKRLSQLSFYYFLE